MILADDILAAVGTKEDVDGMLSSVATALRQAERFVLHDNVARTGYQLMSSKPSTLLASLDRCRVPYPITWIEWKGTASGEAGWDFLPYVDKIAEKPPEFERIVPLRIGCLIESDTKGQRGTMTWVWRSKEHVAMGGLAVYFDFVDKVDTWLDRGFVDPGWTDLIKWHDTHRAALPPRLQKINQQEIKALIEIGDHGKLFYSHHVTRFVNHVMEKEPEIMPELVRSWSGDVSGEALFINCVLMMMQSRNAVEHEPVELDKLNKARKAKNKPPFLHHKITKLHLSRIHVNAGRARGLSDREIEEHKVRGHFKIRRSGVYWWSSHKRGTAHPKHEREQYEVTE